MARVVLKNVKKIYPNTEGKSKKKKDEPEKSNEKKPLLLWIFAG